MAVNRTDGCSVATNAPVIVLKGDGVIRTLVQEEPTGGFGIGVSRFRSTKACTTSLRVSDQHFVGLQLSGPVAVTARLAGRRLDHTPSRGSIGISPLHVDGAVEVRGSVDCIVLRVSPECLALAGTQMGSPGGHLVERMSGRDDVLFSLGRRLEAEARGGRPNGMMYWTSLADAMIRHLVAKHLTSPARPPRDAIDPRVLERVDDYIRANLDAPLDLVSLAAVAGCDRFRFARGFRRTTGVTPHRYVTRLRLSKACALISEKKLTLAEAALATGFYDQSHMTSWFHRVYGTTPAMAAVDAHSRKDLLDRSATRLR